VLHFNFVRGMDDKVQDGGERDESMDVSEGREEVAPMMVDLMELPQQTFVDPAYAPLLSSPTSAATLGRLFHSPLTGFVSIPLETAELTSFDLPPRELPPALASSASCENRMSKYQQSKSSLQSLKAAKRERCTASSSCSKIQPISSRSAGLTLENHIAFMELIANHLELNRRAERDWSALYTEGYVENPDWWKAAFPTVSLFKQKGKLLFLERRGRPQLRFWRELQAQKTPEGIASLLQSKASAFQLPDPGIPGGWQFGPESFHLSDRILKKEKGPGSIIEWPDEARDSIGEKLVLVHKLYGDGFESVTKHFQSLAVQSELELAILMYCDCPLCDAWDLKEIRTQPAELRLYWTKKRASLMKGLLCLHQQGKKDEAFMDAAKKQMPIARLWKDDAILNMMKLSHGSSHCTICIGSNPCAVSNVTSSSSCCSTNKLNQEGKAGTKGEGNDESHCNIPSKRQKVH